jgi:hypothetical protein
MVSTPLLSSRISVYLSSCFPLTMKQQLDTHNSIRIKAVQKAPN